MGFWAGLKHRARQAIRREDGTATVEFVILFPALMTLFLSSFEVSVLLLRTVMLDKALDSTVRQLRLGMVAPSTAEELRSVLCARAPIIHDCSESLLVELQPISTSNWVLPSGTATCSEKDAEIQPAVSVTFGAKNDLMLVRACAKVDPFFAPSDWIMNLVPTDVAGQQAVVAYSTFVNEP